MEHEIETQKEDYEKKLSDIGSRLELIESSVKGAQVEDISMIADNVSRRKARRRQAAVRSCCWTSWTT